MLKAKIQSTIVHRARKHNKKEEQKKKIRASAAPLEHVAVLSSVEHPVYIIPHTPNIRSINP
jgi:hypothetical protein